DVGSSHSPQVAPESLDSPAVPHLDSTSPPSSEQKSPSKDPKSKKSKAGQELKSKMKSRAKAQAKTYEIHNRLFPKLPLRASNSPILAMPLEQYLRLAE